jgi:transposase
MFLKKDGDHEWHSIDATIVRAHQHASGARGGPENQALGKSRGGLSSKIHMKVDALGMPLQFQLTGGEVHEASQAEELINENCDYLIADRGYDSNKIRDLCQEKGIRVVIPGRKCRKEVIAFDEHIYKERNSVERFFCRIKQFRRIATRYDKTAIMFRGALTLVSIILWLQV